MGGNNGMFGSMPPTAKHEWHALFAIYTVVPTHPAVHGPTSSLTSWGAFDSGDLNPPDKALVLCVDENSRIQALECQWPVLPMGLGCGGGITHDYLRHGATSLLAALDGQSGKVIHGEGPGTAVSSSSPSCDTAM